VKDPTIRANRDTFPLQQRANKVLIELAREYGIKLICSNDAHFVDQENAEAHDHLLCLSTGKELDDPTRMLYSKQEWFKTREEMNDIFSDVPEALSNTLEILDKVEIYSIDHDPIMPFFPIPEEFGTEEQWREKYSQEDLFREFTTDENGKNPLSREEGEKKIEKLGGYDKLYRIKFEADYLAKLAYEGAHKIYGKELSKEVDDRIRFELHIMKTMGFPGYFLIVQDFISSARDQLGVMVGPGRGSAAGSVVAYCLGITKIDPLKYDLLFERFLNPDRISLPDIDTDFDDDGRGRVLKWVEDKYGHENCAHIITYATMATKNSIKDVARVEKVPIAVSNALCKAIPDRLPDVDGKTPKMNLTNAIKAVPELRDAEASNDLALRNTIKYAKMLEGTVRGTGIHACGFIICRDPISDWVPVSTADDPDFKDQKTNCTQYDGHVIESTGLIKMDFLGLKTLSEMKEACAVIKQTRGIDIDLDHIPIDDPKTFELYQQGRTIGTFQFESNGMQKYLRELKPTVFEDLIAMNALYRPGPMGYIPQFIRRKHGEEPITYDIPVMEKYLKDTYGVTVYQEQVMLLSRLLAGFTRGQADSLRKAMGKKIAAMLADLKPKFIEGGKKNGHDEQILLKIWGDWEKFASYAFNKSHAACYAWVAYQTGYLKAHYPAEYMAANLTRNKDSIEDVKKFMEECKAMKIPVKGPDINESELNFTANKKGEIRFGLGGIKGVGAGAVEAIVAEREANGKFKDIFDFVERVNLQSCNSKTIQSLAIAGAFDALGIKREPFILEMPDGSKFVDALIRYGNNFQNDRNQNTNTLFGSIGETIDIPHPSVPNFDDMPLLEKLNMEKDLVGIFLSAHPLDPFKFELENFCTVSPVDLAGSLEPYQNREVAFGGLVTEVFDGLTRNNKPFMNFTIEDYIGGHKFALFGKDYEAHAKLIKKNSLLFIRARIEERMYPDKDGNKPLEVKVQSVKLLSNIRGDMVKKLTINIKLKDLNNGSIELIKNVLNSKGNVALYFMVHDEETGLSLNLLSHSLSIEITNDLVDFLDKNDTLFTYSLNNNQQRKRRPIAESAPETDSEKSDTDTPSPDPTDDDDD
jgi:DNA polymerase-3 subunit alpha